MSQSEFIQGRFDFTGTPSEVVIVPPFNQPPTQEQLASEKLGEVRKFKKGKRLRAPNSTQPGTKWVTAQSDFEASRLPNELYEGLAAYRLEQPLVVHYYTKKHQGFQTLPADTKIGTHSQPSRKKR